MFKIPAGKMSIQGRGNLKTITADIYSILVFSCCLHVISLFIYFHTPLTSDHDLHKMIGNVILEGTVQKE